MLIDDVIIKISAGHGGKGAVAFDKNKMAIGPAGGSGGKGGSIIFEGVPDIGALRHFRFRKVIDAENGQEGRSQFRDGHDGKDMILQVPVGTVIHNLTTGAHSDVTKINEKLLLAQGGKGGKGNFLFRGPKDTSPTRFQPGLPGDAFDVRLELKLIADVGLVGLPNAGKSSLINELTKAESRVGNYPFTTLEPSLGAYYELIIADIPGLIEGASEGKGLGVKFLRHVERTQTIFHLVSSESKKVSKDYKIIRTELGEYNPEILKKKEYLFLTKSDMVSPVDLKKQLAALKKLNKNAIAVSIHDFASLEKVKKILNKLVEAKKS
ncbi:MAG: GTPase ObgE [bacterium]|nr:GTPase ObgE [bacterium]